MSNGVTVTRTANKEGLNLGDLRSLIEEAERVGLTADSKVRVQVGWRQQVRRIEVGESDA